MKPPPNPATSTTQAVPAGAGESSESKETQRFQQRYRAISSRDTRFDGQFFTAVKSTGIYCRPSCPARTPKPENVTFFITSAAAHEAGYRACKRCLPEAAPGTPEWDLRQDVAGRAMRLIGDGVVDREGVEGLAGRLGFTARHLNRILIAELGAGPLALARARRAHTARALIVHTDLKLADVAYASGFGSIRQFNDTISAVFDYSPTGLRARTPHRGTSSDSTPTTASAGTSRISVAITLPVRTPYDAAGNYEFLGARAIAGIETADLTNPLRLRYARTVRLPGGPGAFEVVTTAHSAESARRGEWQVTAQLELTALTDLSVAVARIRRLFDLDADSVAISASLSQDPHLSALVAAHPGARLPGCVDPHESVVRAIVGQQISVSAARGHLTRLAESAGRECSSSFLGLSRLFPTPSEILQAVPHITADESINPQRILRLPRRQVNAVRSAASALLDGSLNAHVGAEPNELRSQLLALPGVGPWTAAYIAMRVLGNTDEWLPGDVALVAGARAVGLIGAGAGAGAEAEAAVVGGVSVGAAGTVGSGVDQSSGPSKTDGATGSGAKTTAALHKQLEQHAQRWSPWRSYAAILLWRAATDAQESPARTPAPSRIPEPAPAPSPDPAAAPDPSPNPAATPGPVP